MTPLSVLPTLTPATNRGFSVRRWDQDCDQCQFVGHQGEQDIYLCHAARFHTVIIRFSDTPSDY